MARVTSDCDAILPLCTSNGPNHLGLWCNAHPWAAYGPNHLGSCALSGPLGSTLLGPGEGIVLGRHAASSKYKGRIVVRPQPGW